MPLLKENDCSLCNCVKCGYKRALDHRLPSYRVRWSPNGRGDWCVSQLSKACSVVFTKSNQKHSCSVCVLFVDCLSQSDASCGRQHMINALFNLGEITEQKQSYLSCFLKFFRPLWRLGLNVIKRSAKAGGANQTISKSSCSANPSTVALRITCGKWPGLGVVCHLWGVRVVFGRL